MWCRGRDMRPRKTRKNLATTHSWWIAVKFLHTTESRAHAHYTITGSVLKSVSNVARTYTRRREQIHWSENSPNDFFFHTYFFLFYFFLLILAVRIIGLMRVAGICSDIIHGWGSFVCVRLLDKCVDCVSAASWMDACGGCLSPQTTNIVFMHAITFQLVGILNQGLRSTWHFPNGADQKISRYMIAFFFSAEAEIFVRIARGMSAVDSFVIKRIIHNET